MIDYSICLIELQKAIKGYREATLKNNDKKKLEHCSDLISWAVRLSNCTVEDMKEQRTND